ncbi:MAG: response regulator transcription factor [Paracoccaceae bacterium]
MAQMKKILLVDDEEDLRDALAEQLLITGEFLIEQAGSARETLDQIGRQDFDIIILDIGLPDTDGRELCRIMRKQNVKCPIIMLTGQDSDADTILGLDAGANDYVTKPFKFPVLLARIRSQLRQFEQTEDANFLLGTYIFKPAQKFLLKDDGRKIRLTEKETNILKYLLRAENATVQREVLLHEVWGYNAGVTTHTLETHIYRLRQKIEPDPSQAKLLVTESGGYKIVA